MTKLVEKIAYNDKERVQIALKSGLYGLTSTEDFEKNLKYYGSTDHFF